MLASLGQCKTIGEKVSELHDKYNAVCLEKWYLGEDIEEHRQLMFSTRGKEQEYHERKFYSLRKRRGELGSRAFKLEKKLRRLLEAQEKMREGA